MSEDELDKLLFYAFIHAINRMIYVADDVCDLLLKHKDKLFDTTKELIIKNVKIALNRDVAGMEWDREQWEAFIFKLEQ